MANSNFRGELDQAYSIIDLTIRPPSKPFSQAPIARPDSPLFPPDVSESSNMKEYFREMADLSLQLEAMRNLDGIDVLEPVPDSPVSVAFSPTRAWNPLDDADLQDAYGDLVERLVKEDEVAKDFRDGVQIIKLWKHNDFDPRFVKEFGAITNMIKHMHVMLFDKEKPKAKLNFTVMNEIKGIATQIIHYMDIMEYQLIDDLQKLKETAHQLPTLGAETADRHLTIALRIAIKLLTPALTAPRESEEMLWPAFRTFFHAQVYDALVQLRKDRTQKHGLLILGEYLDEIDAYIPAIELLYKHHVKENEKLAEAMKITRTLIFSEPRRYYKIFMEDLLYYVVQKKHASFAPSTSTTFVKDLASMTDEELADEQAEFSRLIMVLEERLALEREAREAEEREVLEEGEKGKLKRAYTT